MQAHRAAVARWTAAVLAFPLAAVPFVVVDVPFDHPGGVVPPQVPRVAFTDDRDEIAVKAVERGYDGSTTYTVADEQSGPPELSPEFAETAHSGELSAYPEGYGNFEPLYAFVSTVDDPLGEVYVVGSAVQGVRRVTCNDDVESHPVIDDFGGTVAYASDRSGDFDIWAARLNSYVEPTTTPSPTAQPDPCPGPVPMQVTVDESDDDPSDDLWPSWLPNSDQLIFSSNRLNPLGDLFTVGLPVDSSDQPVPPQTPRALTDDAYADSQPAAGNVEIDGFLSPWVVFTSTRHRADGSLYWFELPRFGEPTISPFWPDANDPTQPAADTMQSSEGSWSRDGHEVVFTTTAFDPYGDVHLTPIDTGSYPPQPSLGAGTTVPVAAAPGVAETHGGWLQGFETDPVDAPSTAQVSFTTRSVDADIAAVIAANGSDRLTLAAAPRGYDQAGPAYSPDGRQLVYSRAPGSDGGRELMLVQADGQGMTELNYDRAPRDVDVDPAWSPDGTRIAFVRHVWNGDGYEPPAIWVTTPATGATSRISLPAAAGELQYDEGPTWSPDSSRLAVSRAVVTTSDASVAIQAPDELTEGDFSSADVVVDNAGPTPVIDVVVEIAVPTALTDDPATPEGCTSESAGPDALFRCSVHDLGADPRVVTIDLYGGGIGDHTISASVSGEFYDPDPCNDSTTAVVTVPDNGRWPRSETNPALCPPINRGVARAAPGSPPIAATPLILTMDAVDGTGEIALGTLHFPCPVEPCQADPVYGRSPAWSHDGSRIAYESNGELRAAVLAGDSAGPVVPETVTTIEHLTGFDAAGLPTASRGAISVAEDPAWAPDDSAVAFAGQPAGQPDQRGIYEIEPDGTGLRELAQLRQPETEPAYQPPPVFPPISYSPTISVSPSTTTPTVTTPTITTPTITTPTVTTPTAPDESPDLSVTVTLVQPEAWVGGEPVVVTFTVRNDGSGAAEDVRLTTAYPAFVSTVARTGAPACAAGMSECLLGTIASGAARTVQCTVSLQAEVIVPAAPGVPPSTAPAVTAGIGDVTGRITSAAADPDPTDDSATATLTVHQPTIRLLPPIGRPGEVVLAYGEEFPPGAAIELRWSRGITADSRSFAVQPDGTFRWPLLVIRRDVLGERLAAAATPATSQRLFGGVNADMLVVPRSVSPPSFLGRG